MQHNAPATPICAQLPSLQLIAAGSNHSIVVADLNVMDWCQRGQILPNGSLWKDRRRSKSVADFDDVQVDPEGMRTIDACV